MTFDYCKLRGKICEVFGNQGDFAKSIGMSATSLSMKLNNRVEFTQREIDRASDLLRIKKEEIPIYFFTPKVQQAEQIR